MLNLFKKKNGTISIFLVIILVPMITVTSLFVDVSRIKLSQSVVNSAGDLTMNTILTHYDKDLSDYYGMMASSQDIDEFLAVTEEYFTACIKSTGLGEQEAKSYTQQLMKYINGDEEISDLLQMSVANGSFAATKVTDGNLHNPALVKTQIVEFMKYRSPINAAKAIFDSLTNMKDKMEDVPYEDELTEEKKEYYEKENELLEKAYEVYKKMRKYQELGITETYVNDMSVTLDGLKERYRTIHKKLVFDVYNTSGMKKFTGRTINITPYISKPYTSDKLATAGEMKNMVWNTQIAMQTYVDAKKRFDTNVNAIGYDGNTVWDVQYWVATKKIIDDGDWYDNYVDAANSLYYNIALLKNARANHEKEAELVSYTLPKREGVTAEGDKLLFVHYDDLVNQFSGIEEDVNAVNNTYKQFVGMLELISANAIDDPTSLSPNNTIGTDKLEAEIKDIYDTLNGYLTTITDAESQLTTLVDDLDDLYTLAKEYKIKFEDWEDAANNSHLEGNDYANQDKAEIERLKEIEEITQKVSETAVSNMQQRLNNIKSLLGTMREAVKGYKYGPKDNGRKAVYEIDTLKKAKKASGIDGESISQKKTELETYASNSFKFKKASNPIHNITNENNPDLDVAKPGLYKWLDDKFKEAYENEGKDTDKGTAEEIFESFEKDADNTEDESKDESQCGDKNKDLYGMDGLATKSFKEPEGTGKKGGITAATDFISSLFGDFFGTMSGVGKDIRDDLYVVDYIMSMFSYDTFEKEVNYKWASEKKEVTLKDLPNAYQTQEIKNKWEESKTNTTITDNKTITNRLICQENNYMYGAEVEYILYGGKRSTNIAKSYGSIYMMRFALDAAPVFMQFWTTDTEEGVAVEAIATAISTATYGIIPVALVKTIICLAILAMEAATDLVNIKEGIPVMFIKSREDLFISFPDVDSEDIDDMKGVKPEAGDSDGVIKDGKIYFQYSDYITLFLVLGLVSESNSDKMYLRIADVVQTNMGLAKGKIDDKNVNSYSLGKSQVYFKIATDIKVDPLMMSMPINGDVGDVLDTSTWNTYKYSVIGGY